MNKGIKLATGEIIGFLHSDDEFACKSVLASVATVFEDNRNISAVYGDLKYVKRCNSEITVRHWRSRSFENNLLRKGWMPPHPTFYVKKRWYIKIGYFNLKYKISADYNSIFQLFGYSDFNSVYLSKVLVKMKLGGVSNKSINSVFLKSYEDWKVLRSNGVSIISSVIALFLKNFLKINQFFS